MQASSTLGKRLRSTQRSAVSLCPVEKAPAEGSDSGTTSASDFSADSQPETGAAEAAARRKRPREAAPKRVCRRSSRDLQKAELSRKDVRTLLAKIKRQHSCSVVLKVKEHLKYDVGSAVIDAILHALHSNHKCQALYLQNLNLGIRDEQIDGLAELLKVRTNIWCLNLGENYEVSSRCWERFCAALADTHVTHIYLSEHTITASLKNRIRAVIRENRKKHDLHCSEENYDVIVRCTNMWWNPINGLKNRRMRELEAARRPQRYQHIYTIHEVDDRGEAREVVSTEWDGYWQFNCLCGKVCSSNNPWRDHPTGRMFECTQCGTWAHTECELGDVEDDEVPDDVKCHRCIALNERRARAMQRLADFPLEQLSSESG